jgi:small-conductance mechanosensitive channel
MISEFTELSDKIDRLAELTLSLRAENTQLRQWNTQVRQSNAQLFAEKEACLVRLHEVQRRVEALLAQMPDPNAVTAATAPAAASGSAP